MAIISFICFLLFFTSSVSSTKEDEDALLKFKKQLGDPDFLQSWVKGFNFCNYSTNSSSGVFVSIKCTSTGRVYSILVMDIDSNITAPFPDAVCDLTELDSIGIDGFLGLYGSIPSCITNLWKLRYIDILHTSLSGPVPNFYNHTKLTTIRMIDNHLSGTIPSSLSTLPNLEYLNLYHNSLTGTIPTGLPSREIDLSFNNLTGEIPKCYEWVDFFAFSVDNNHLTGDASFLFGKNISAQVILLGSNEFEFDLSHVEFSDNLRLLDLNHNKIFGKVPDSLHNMLFYAKYEELDVFKQLDLSFNKLCGELPQPQGGKMWQFGPDIFANNSCLCGYPLPPCSGSSPAPAPVPAPVPF